MAQLVLPDGSRQDASGGQSIFDAVRAVDPKLTRDLVAAQVEGEIIDLSTPMPSDGDVCLVAKESEDGLAVLRHSMAHIMADAVLRLFPDAKLAIGPAIESGFYYDIDCEHRFSDEDLLNIERQMKRVIKENTVFERKELARADALTELATDDLYKKEIIEGLDDAVISTYTHGQFTDICRGPHIFRTGLAGKAFKLLSVAGAYWRGDENRQMLQRIYGTAFWSREALEAHLKRLKEAHARDHRVLGKQLGLFSIDEEIGPGLILWHPKGNMVRMLVEDFWKQEHLKRGYVLVSTPHIASERIFEHSGHLENYADNMYAGMEIENKPYRLKPMNCPGHIKIYQTQTHSYRDLPLRMGELGTVYRYERSGVLHGMLRVRGFTQDDAHIFCTPEQISDEVLKILELMDVMMDAFGYNYKLFLATMPEKHLGSEEEWNRATDALKVALEKRGQPYEMDEGGGAFYAPKIDVKLCDAIGREWQGPTIQVDLNLPKRFNINYVGSDNAEHEVIMIHRTVLGSMERFVGGLIEHYAGAFPAWLAPEQVRVLPISDPYADYGRKVRDELRMGGFRAELDAGNEKIGARIRNATLDKVPYMLIVGEKEQAENSVSVRHRTDGDQGSVTLDEFKARLKTEVDTKA
jgi:threonyl-tRNA synthetase